MKKAKSSRRLPAGKAATAPKNFDEYLATIPEPARPALIKMREAIRSVVPAAATETISYKIPAFQDNGILVWFAGFSRHCSLFPKSSIIESFKNELTGFTVSKGTIQFPLDKPLPLALIKKIVKARVAQHKSHKSR